ncbi:hypothetical protein [Roseateles koreensis]|uniref:Uncharacterized protein n=1 Tax=Roseateles koreensis TaxID=2987526 RepID=A0ABT5KWN3_9BURK|nr:hypothetical protein [Roseateles koreensis]MDC8787201.1 hypothetical protein [Roseateles koreensis]
MKTIVLALALAALLPVSFQAAAQSNITTNPNAKVDPKNNKVGKPVVEKPKPKVMTRDELRSCMNLYDANTKEALSIKEGQQAYKDQSVALKKEKDDLQKEEDAYSAEVAEFKKEREGILKMNEDIRAAAPKMEKEELEAKRKEYEARAAKFDASAAPVIERGKTLAAKRKVFSDKVDPFNASFKALEERTEAHLDKVDSWKAECGNKAYDEADEQAIKKERAAAAPAAK